MPSRIVYVCMTISKPEIICHSTEGITVNTQCLMMIESLPPGRHYYSEAPPSEEVSMSLIAIVQCLRTVKLYIYGKLCAQKSMNCSHVWRSESFMLGARSV
jgi:hypothetical protein